MKITFRCLPELEAILPPPIPAKRGLPDWIKRMPMTALSEEFDTRVKTVKQCPPFIDAMSYGFVIPLPCDLHYEAESFAWDWSELPPGLPRHTSRAPLGLHLNAQVEGSPLFEPDSLLIKFMNYWTIELEPGYSLLAGHPTNRPDLPFRTVTGLVDADLYTDNYVHFPAAWIDRDFKGVLPKGTPVAQCVPVPRQGLELVTGQLDPEAQARLNEVQEELPQAEGSYRKRFRQKKA